MHKLFTEKNCAIEGTGYRKIANQRLAKMNFEAMDKMNMKGHYEDYHTA